MICNISDWIGLIKIFNESEYCNKLQITRCMYSALYLFSSTTQAKDQQYNNSIIFVLLLILYCCLLWFVFSWQLVAQSSCLVQCMKQPIMFCIEHVKHLFKLEWEKCFIITCLKVLTSTESLLNWTHTCLNTDITVDWISTKQKYFLKRITSFANTYCIAVELKKHIFEFSSQLVRLQPVRLQGSSFYLPSTPCCCLGPPHCEGRFSPTFTLPL